MARSNERRAVRFVCLTGLEIQKESENVIKNEVTGKMRRIVSKNEFGINELNMRVTDLESNIKELKPNFIRLLIKNDLELMMNDQQKKIGEDISTIKGSQIRNGQLVDILQDELKMLDTRLHKDMEHKIEKKDLTNTKKQIRRKVVIF